MVLESDVTSDFMSTGPGQSHMSFRGGQGHGEGHIFKHVHDLLRTYQWDVHDEVEHFVCSVVDVGHGRVEDVTGGLHWADQLS